MMISNAGILATARIVGALALGLFCAAGVAAPKGPAAVDTKRLINADKEPGNWMSSAAPTPSSATARSTRSTTHNVGQLGLAWYYDLEHPARHRSARRSSSTA